MRHPWYHIRRQPPPLRGFHTPSVSRRFTRLRVRWFHIPSAKRAKISLFLNLAYIFQILNCVFCLYYWPYLATQTWPGAFLINVPALGAISTQIAAGCVQGA